MADTSNILINGVIFSTLKHTDPHTVRGRSTQKDGECNEHIFRNGSFRELKIACPRLSVSENDRKSERATATGELKIAKESNDLADLAKVLPESYPKSNESSVNRKRGQNVATDDRRTFTDKDKVRRIQTLGNVILALVIASLDFISKVIQIFVYEIRHSLARHEYLQGGQQQFFIVFFSVCATRH